jgi:glycosyltransferase involved in cell wall biosynthesis
MRSREGTLDDSQYVSSRGAWLPRIAVLVPRYNEAPTIHQVVTSFRAALPSATIFVYDNNSRDGTEDVARTAGAVVRQETRQGKGHVVRRMPTSMRMFSCWWTGRGLSRWGFCLHHTPALARRRSG